MAKITVLFFIDHGEKTHFLLTRLKNTNIRPDQFKICTIHNLMVQYLGYMLGYSFCCSNNCSLVKRECVRRRLGCKMP